VSGPRRASRAACRVAAATLAALVGACTPSPGEVPGALPGIPGETVATAPLSQTVTDDLGRTVILFGRRRDVVATTPALVGILLALDLTPAGRPAESNDPPGVLDLPSVGASVAPNRAVLEALRPDLVLVEVGVNDDLADSLPGPVYGVDLSGLAATLDALAEVGAVVGRTDQAEAQIRSIEADRATAGAVQGSYVVVVGTPAAWWVAGPDSYQGDLPARLGGTNAAAVGAVRGPGAGWAEATVAEIARWDPDAVLAVSLGPDSFRQAILDDPTWSTVQAVADGRVVGLSDALYRQGVGSRTGEALLDLGNLL